MREVELEKSGSWIYQDNEERIDPDIDFSHIDKRIQDVLGQYQKDFMGEFSADNLGPRFGGYGSFLPVDRYYPVPTLTRSQANISLRSPHNSTTEVRQNPTIQADESIPVRLRLGIPPLSGQATSALDNTFNVRSSRDVVLKNQPKAVSANIFADDLMSFRLKAGSGHARDNSAIYTGLGLEMSPSSSLGDSPSNLNGTLHPFQGSPEESPSYIIKVMTSFPVPSGKLLSPLSESLVSLEKKKEIILERSFPCLDTVVKVEHESISSEGKMDLLKERKVKQTSRNKVSEIEKITVEDPTSIIGRSLKRMDVSKRSKGKEIAIENPAGTEDMHFEKKGTLTIIEKDNVSRTFSLNERSRVAQLVDVGAEFEKQSHVKQEPALEYGDSLAFPVASIELKGNSDVFSEKIQINKDVSSAIKSDAGNDKLSQTGYVEHNPKKFKALKKKVKDELQDSFSSRDVDVRHMPLAEEDSDKSSKQRRNMKNKVKVLPKSTSQEVGAYHDSSDRSMEKIHNGRKPSSTMEKGFKDMPLKNEEPNFFLGIKDLDGATSEPLEESSSMKNLPRFQIGTNVNNRKDRPSSEGKKKTRKSREGSQSSVSALPKVSFRVGSSSALSQPTDYRSDFVSHGETRKEARKVKGQSNDVAGSTTFKKEDKITATKDSIIGIAKREKYAVGSKLKDKSDSNQHQHPSNANFNQRADPTDIAHFMDKALASGAVPTENAPVVIQENWVECDKCQTWRLLPHNIKPDDLPKRWLCSMLTWLPGMNKCSFTEEETRDALRLFYQPPPAVNDAQIHQTYPNEDPPLVIASNKQPAGITLPVTGLDDVPDCRKREPKQEVHAKSKTDQLRAVESGNKQKLNQSKSGDSKQVVIGKKREGSKDTHGALKKAKRDSHQSSKGRNRVVPSGTEIGSASLNNDRSAEISKDLVIEGFNISSKQIKDKTHPSVTNEDERKDIPAKKRKLNDWNNGPVGTDLPSSKVPFKERDDDLRKEKRQKLKDLTSQEKESNSTRRNDKSGGGDQDKVSYGGSSRKTGRRDERPSDQHYYKNMSHMTVEGRKSSRSDPELKIPALTAATSSSSKISSTCRVKLKSQAKCSPVGSISSSPMKVSRSDHDRTRDQSSTPGTKREFSMVKKKNPEARVVAPDFTHHFQEREEGLSKKGLDAEVQFHPVQVDGVDKKISPVKHVDGNRMAKQIGIEFKKEEGDSSCRKSVHIDECARSVNIVGLNKLKYENMVLEKARRKHDQAGRSRDNPSSSTQVLVDFEKVDGFDDNAADDCKGKRPKEPDCGKLAADCVGASSSVRKDNPDRAARTALKEAKDLKHSANRLKVNSGSGVSTQVFFQAALKFLQGASLLESDNPEGTRCGDMNSSEVYRSTAKLCLYCAHEFEKLTDMASAALAYKCMEVAYMRVVYASDVPASRDRQELQLAQAEVHQVESPSSSASDVDNVNNLTPNEAAVKATQSAAVHGNYVISAGNRPNFVGLLNFAEDVNLAMDAARKSQNAFAAARSTPTEAGNGEGMSSIKRVLDFSFHDVDEFLYLVRLAME